MAWLQAMTLAVVLALGGAVGEAHAAPPAATAAAAASVEVTLVRAWRDGSGVDPALSAVAADLRALPYTRYERVGGGTVKLVAGQSGKVSLGLGVETGVQLDALSADAATTMVDVRRDGSVLTHTQIARPLGRAGTVGAGKDGAASLVVLVRVLR